MYSSRHVPPLPLIAKFEQDVSVTKLLELKDGGSSRRLVTSHNIVTMKVHISLKMYLNFRVVPSPTNKKFQ